MSLKINAESDSVRVLEVGFTSNNNNGCKNVGKALLVLAATVAVAALVVFAFPALATAVTGGLIAASVLATLAIVAKCLLAALLVAVALAVGISLLCGRGAAKAERALTDVASEERGDLPRSDSSLSHEDAGRQGKGPPLFY